MDLVAAWIGTGAWLPAAAIVVAAVLVNVWESRPLDGHTRAPDVGVDTDTTAPLKKLARIIDDATSASAVRIKDPPDKLTLALSTEHQETYWRARALIIQRRADSSKPPFYLLPKNSLAGLARRLKNEAGGPMTLRHATSLAARHHLASARASDIEMVRAITTEKLWLRNAAHNLQLEIARQEAAAAAARLERVHQDIKAAYEAACVRRDHAIANCIRIQVACTIVYMAMLLHARVPYIACNPVPKFSWRAPVSYVRASACNAVLDAQTTVYSMVPTVVSLMFVFSPMRAIMLGLAILSTISPATLQDTGMKFSWALLPVLAFVLLRHTLLGNVRGRYLSLRERQDISHQDITAALEPPVWKLSQNIWLSILLPAVAASSVLVTLALAIPL